MTTRHTGIRPNLVRLAVTAVLGTATFATSVPAWSAEESESLDEVQVTGTRIRRANDFDTANPTTVIDSDFFRNLGIVNVGDAVRALPSNVSNNTPTTTGNANFFAGSTIANLRGLNPFFGSRTLTLVNGRRHVPTNQGDGVDLNFIPSILIDRIDVVTGGASAAYGSGAISGVNNIFLTQTLEGVKLEADYGQSSRDDGRDRRVAAAFGTRFANDRGHFSLAYENQNSDAMGCQDIRNWCALDYGTIPNTAAGSYNPATGTFTGPPTNVYVNNVRSPITSAGLWYQTFGVPPTLQTNDAGTGVVAYNPGTGNQSFWANVQGGDGRRPSKYTNLRAPVDRELFAGTFSFQITESVRLTADASYGEVQTINRTGGFGTDTTFAIANIAPDNAYVALNPGLKPGFDSAAFVVPTPGGPFVIGASLTKDWSGQVDSFSEFNTDVKRFSIGLDGRFGDSSWTWDGYYQYGETERSQLVNDNKHSDANAFAIDAVFDDRDAALPINARRIECRVTQSIRNNSPTAPPAGSLQYNRAQGCVPINPFGIGTLDTAARAYSFGYLLETLTYKQHVFAVNATGDLWDGFGAGTVKGAVGAEYRMEDGENIGSQNDAQGNPVPDYVRTDYLIQYGESFAGDVDVIEVYGEVNLPLLRDVTMAERLELDLAARYSRYDNQGGFGTTGENRTHDMVTWKASAIWDPVEWLRVRGSQSRDSRAANFRELYYGQKISAGGLFGFCTPATAPPGSPRDACNWSLEGNVDLEPEKSDTTTVGLVFQPRDWLPGFEFAVDYFRIKISDGIQQANIGRVQNGCQISGIQEFCDLITPDPGGGTPLGPLPTPGTDGYYNYNPLTGAGIQDIRALAFNGSGYNYRGLDFSAQYSFDMGDAGGINLRLLATHMLEQSVQLVPGQPFVDVVGQTGNANSFLSDYQPSAEWLGNLSATYVKGPFTTTLNMRYVGEGVRDYLGVTPQDSDYTTAPANFVRYDRNDTPSYVVFGLNASYRFENLGFVDGFEVWGNISNLFDKEPPLVGNGTGGTNPVFYDAIGRYFRVGVRAQF
jgi:outer membrane receptor protein involved in Fe transport